LYAKNTVLASHPGAILSSQVIALAFLAATSAPPIDPAAVAGRIHDQEGANSTVLEELLHYLYRDCLVQYSISYIFLAVQP
jgi:hypothetical protein